MTKVLGLTGGIASGKSTVSDYYRAHGILVIDGDVVARQVVEPGQPGLAQLIESFGPTIVSKDGKLDRKHLASLVFGNEKKLKLLNSIMGPLIHGKIRAELKAAVLAKVPWLILDLPLLFEGHYQELCDKVLVLDLPEEIQVARIMERDGATRQAARNRVKSQLARKRRVELADWVVDSSGQAEQTLAKVRALVTSWLVENKINV